MKTDLFIWPAGLGVTDPFREVPDAEILRVLREGYFADFPEKVRPYFDWYAVLVIRLYARHPVDVLWIYFIEADIIGHFGFYEAPPGTIVRGYGELDRTFGLLIR